MGIFGDLDAASVESNPFFVAAGEYPGQVHKVEIRTNREEQRQFFIEYLIVDPTSEFDGSRVQKYYPMVDKDLTAEKIKLLPPSEQAEIRKMNADLKRALCGNEGVKNQPGLGVTVDDLNDPDWETNLPKKLIGRDVTIAVQNFGLNNQGVGLRWANVIQDPSDVDQ